MGYAWWCTRAGDGRRQQVNDYVTCPRCGGNYDHGELKGGICDDCRAEEARREREADFLAGLSEQADGQVTFLRLTPQYAKRMDRHA